MVSPANQTRETALLASKLGARLWRINVGLAWVGEIVQKSDEILVLKNPRPFKAGEKGMGDSLGFVRVLVTPEMVGTYVPIILSVENKQGKGRLEPLQIKWRDFIRSVGGRAGVSRNDEDTRKIIAGEICD